MTTSSTVHVSHRHAWLASLALAALLILSSCGGTPPPKPPLTQQQPLEALLKVAAFPNSENLVLFITMQEFLASHREWEGYAYFDKLAREQPNRRTLFRAMQAAMQASVANDVPLLRRVAWVEDAIAKLDEAARADPLFGRFARGLVLSRLPERFGRAQQAKEDLEASLNRRAEFPLGLDRGIYRGLAAAEKTLGHEARAREMLSRSGATSFDDPKEARILSNLSVDPKDGFRFGEKRLLREADGVYVAEGYDFANIGFIVGARFVVAIDAGTTEQSAGQAVAALRQVTRLPIKYVILTHGHWDHAGGLAAVREPGSIVIAERHFPEVLAHSRSYDVPFHYFFGTGKVVLDVKPDRLIATPETLTDGDVTLDLIPAPSGETSDALFIRDTRHDVLFVGDAFMPYVGAPFVAEGSPEGFLGAIDKVIELRPRRLVHGHPPLTTLFTLDAMPGLRDAARELYARTLTATRRASPLAEVLRDNFIPEALRSAPKSSLPYVVMRDTFIQRLYTGQAGYWESNGHGMDHFTDGEWAAALDLLGGESDGAFARAVDELNARGDAALALQIAEFGLARHPDSSKLKEGRERALLVLRQVYSQTNPFRFIIYSERAGQKLPPVETAPPATPAQAP
jgi:glyoxylase-like metal-dependent hydrolase (beta-lactamase superfamily II)